MFKASAERVKVLGDNLLEAADESQKNVGRLIIAKNIQTALAWPNSSDDAKDLFFDAKASVGPLSLRHDRFFALSYDGIAMTTFALGPKTGVIEKVVRALDYEDMETGLLQNQTTNRSKGGVILAPTQEDYDLVIAELEHGRDNPGLIHVPEY